ncbi:MAG: histidinol dehydrogenase [Phycisphaerales bacterium]|nr:histidinol dehydrogenase [Phycisphaerales bacterium]
MLRRVNASEVRATRFRAVDDQTLEQAGAMVRRVEREGVRAVRELAERFGERRAGDPLVLGRKAMLLAYAAMDAEDRACLERTAERIERFARAQLVSIRALDTSIEGGRAGHTLSCVRSAGCYVPAGRSPLPSTALMTAVTARVAGCERVVVASPGAHPMVLAACSIAGVDEVLAVGGAHAIAAMAFGFEAHGSSGEEAFEPCDMIVGPGNRWVTAAKQMVSGVVGIDMLAGPSELLVLADETADAAVVAADLLAQAEHDTDARAMLVTTSAALADAVDEQLREQLESLPTRATARAGLGNGFSCVVASIEEALLVSDLVGPEHLELMMQDAEAVATRVRNAGGVFIGARAAEVLGDYGAGPNHTLPTGGTARFRAGLSVMHFLRLRTWMRMDDSGEAAGLVADSERLARMEGLPGHERSAAKRRVTR